MLRKCFGRGGASILTGSGAMLKASCGGVKGKSCDVPPSDWESLASESCESDTMVGACDAEDSALSLADFGVGVGVSSRKFSRLFRIGTAVRDVEGGATSSGGKKRDCSGMLSISGNGGTLGRGSLTGLVLMAEGPLRSLAATDRLLRVPVRRRVSSDLVRVDVVGLLGRLMPSLSALDRCCCVVVVVVLMLVAE